MADNRSPEDRLLNLIRRDTGRGAPARQKERADAQLGDIRGKLLRVCERARGLVVPSLPKVRWVLFVSACAYFFSALFISFMGAPEVPVKPEPWSIPAPPVSGAADGASLETYLESVQRQSAFVRPVDDAVAPLPTRVVGNLQGGFALVGVIADVDPQAIVEDRTTGQTVYLRKGQTWNDFVVRDVREGTLILDRSGETFEYHL